MKTLEIPLKLVYVKFYVHEKVLRTRYCRRKFIKKLLPQKRKENIPIFPWEYREFLLLRDVCPLGFKNQCLTNCSVTHSIAYIDISHSFNCLITSSMNDKKCNGRVSFFS